jgi:nitrate reductase NapAB chaperone NapD
MINGIYIADSQGEIFVERTFTTAPSQESIKKLIRSQFPLDTAESSGPGAKMIWEVDDSYVFATRRGRVIFLALTKDDAFVPEIYEILAKLEAVLEAALVNITIDNVKENSTEILIVSFK